VPVILSQEQLDKELYTLFDIDGSGVIELNDLDCVARAMGWK